MKLTNEMRNAVTTKALKGFMQAEKDAIEQRRLAFGTEVYEYTYSKDEPIALQLDGVWRDMDCEVLLICDGFEKRWAGSDIDSESLNAVIPLGRDRPFPPTHAGTRITVNAAKKDFPEHPLYKKAAKLVKDHCVIVNKEDELRNKIKALLRSCNTVAQLEAAWPEGVQFLPTRLSYSTALVPVGMSDQINKALGIPSKASVSTTAVRKAASH